MGARDGYADVCVCVVAGLVRCGGGRAPARALRRPASSLGRPRGPAGGRRNSRELPPARSCDRFSSQPCTSGAVTASIGRLGAPRPRIYRHLGHSEHIAIRPYAIAAAGNFDAVANAHSNHDCWRAVCRLRCSVGGVFSSLWDARLRWLEAGGWGVRTHAYKHPHGAQDSVGSNPPPESHVDDGAHPVPSRTEDTQSREGNIINYSGAKTTQ